jgi:hypothetical protein
VAVLALGATALSLAGGVDLGGGSGLSLLLQLRLVGHDSRVVLELLHERVDGIRATGCLELPRLDFLLTGVLELQLGHTGRQIHVGETEPGVLVAVGPKLLRVSPGLLKSGLDVTELGVPGDDHLLLLTNGDQPDVVIRPGAFAFGHILQELRDDTFSEPGEMLSTVTERITAFLLTQHRVASLMQANHAVGKLLREALGDLVASVCQVIPEQFLNVRTVRSRFLEVGVDGTFRIVEVLRLPEGRCFQLFLIGPVHRTLDSHERILERPDVELFFLAGKTLDQGELHLPDVPLVDQNKLAGPDAESRGEAVAGRDRFLGDEVDQLHVLGQLGEVLSSEVVDVGAGSANVLDGGFGGIGHGRFSFVLILGCPVAECG